MTASYTPGPTRSWLWPNRTIGKAESATLREEHNALVNQNADLVEALRELQYEVDECHCGGECGLNDALDRARAILAKVEGR